MGKKKLPIGISDFKELIEKECLFFDKTLIIKEILEDVSKVRLFTRPRRFGKTLTLSMIDNFFNIRKKEENKNLFDGLKIMETEYRKRLGSNPVINISFKGIKNDNSKYFKENIMETILELIDKYKEVFNNLSQIESNLYEKLVNYEEVSFQKVLKFLSKKLYEYYGKKVIILIDEYDTPLISAYVNGYYDEVKGFISKIYSEALKDNEYLEFAIITGILKVAKEGIFSGLNHIKVNNIFSESASEYFGFTYDEVKNVLKEYEVKDSFSDICLWYDGYLFGNTHVFNPWSILNYLDNKKLVPYWVNTSSDDLIYKLFSKLTKDYHEKIKRLINGESIEVNIYEDARLEDVENIDNLWQLLLYAGYLTVDKEISYNHYLIRMVNKEISETLERRFIKSVYGLESVIKMRRNIELLLKGNYKDFEDEINYMLRNGHSYYNFERESSYKIYFATILSMVAPEMIIECELESGSGRSDVLFYNPDTKKGYLLEFKKDKNIEKAIKEAKKQIIDRRYKERFEKLRIKDYTIYAVGCFNKNMVIELM